MSRPSAYRLARRQAARQEYALTGVPDGEPSYLAKCAVRSAPQRPASAYCQSDGKRNINTPRDQILGTPPVTASWAPAT